MYLGLEPVEYMPNIDFKISGNSMWPNFRDGDIVSCQHFDGQQLNVGDIVIFPSPHDSTKLLIKRIVRINFDMCFVQGDNPDPTASTDSHNFGAIPLSTVVGFRHADIQE
jgi:phage repressor protein C with HTH and peptisase S24 domain